MARGKAVVDALVSEDTQDTINQNPYFQVGVLLLIFGVGAYLQLKGIRGIKEGTITDKRGREYTGKTAKVLGGVYLGCGLSADIIAAVMLYQHLM